MTDGYTYLGGEKDKLFKYLYLGKNLVMIVRPNMVVMKLKRKMNRKEYNKLYHQRPEVIERKKKYFKEYNARPEVKQARHEWYINKIRLRICDDRYRIQQPSI